MTKFEYDNKKWDIETDTTTVHLSTTFVKAGVARTEVIVKEGTPKEIEALMANKTVKILYAWNVKILTRESLNKNGMVKYRETACVQAEGIRGDGKAFTPEEAEDTEGVVDNDVARVVRTAQAIGKKIGVKTYLLGAAIIALLVAIGVTVYKIFKGVK